MSEAPSAIELRAPRGATVMEIDWSDGTTARYPHALLRGFCPCAHCQGHQGPIQWAGGQWESDPSATELADIEEMGNYALRLAWADGHSTGLYTFVHLRQLATIAERPIDEAKRARFSR
jgi:DUF971 family protein